MVTSVWREKGVGHASDGPGGAGVSMAEAIERPGDRKVEIKAHAVIGKICAPVAKPWDRPSVTRPIHARILAKNAELNANVYGIMRRIQY
jgi:hypothetical protein